MKLVPFTYTNEYDNQVDIQINPDFVERIRPNGKTQTDVFLVSKAQITVDGSIATVAKALCANIPDTVASAPTEDYDPEPEGASV